MYNSNADTLGRLLTNVIKDALAEMLDQKFAQMIERMTPKPEVVPVEPQEKPEVDGYTAKEVCRLLHIKEVTLWRWQNDGRVNPVKIGRRRVFLKADIQRLLKH